MAQNTHNPFVICKAAAGSGKTFTLVKEYLKLAMEVPSAEVRRDTVRWEHELRRRFAGILAITFTNKAAGEMKDRVMRSLYEMVSCDGNPALTKMGRLLLDALNALPCYADQPLTGDDLRWMATVVHSAILHNYTDLSVCTIDSFMHRIVRTFAHDLDRPVNFDVMVEEREMVDHAVDGLMALLGSDGNEELTRMVEAYADSLMEDGKSYNIEGALTGLATQLFKEDTDRYLESLKGLQPADFIAVQRALSQECHAFEQRVRSCGQKMLDALARLGATESDCASGASGFYSFFRQAAAGRMEPLKSKTVRAFEEGKLASGKCSKEVKDSLEAAFPDLTDIYLEMRGLVGSAVDAEEGEGDLLRDYHTRQLLLRNLYTVALLDALAGQLRLYAKENDVIHLSEFNRMIGSIVAEEPAPFIYERLGNRYHHFLIDEFQDTSVLQWHNLVPLLENGVSQRYESLVVGDGKQAIYRFRQGDVSQFVELPHVSGMQLHGHTLEQPGNYSIRALNRNYRTARCVVGFNNAFFEWLLQQDTLKNNPLAQQIYIGRRDADGHPELYQEIPSPDIPEGYVEVHFTDKDDNNILYEYIRQTIVRLVREQGYRQSDIMVLGREKKDLDRVSIYLQSHPEEMRIDVTSSESFFLTRSHAVMAMVAVLRLLHDPSDRVAAADLMHRLFYLGLVGSTHAEAFLGKGPVDVQSLLRTECSAIDLRLDYLASLDLYDCCEAIVRQLKLDGFDVAYMGSFLGRVAEFASRRHEGVDAFLEWFDDNASADFGSSKHRQLSAASPDGIDAVRLLTIHAAKGLEAPVVICPIFHKAPKNYKLWVDVEEGLVPESQRLPVAFVEMNRKVSTRFDEVRDREHALEEVDRLNVLYVALTRPKDQLFIVCPEPGDKSESDSTHFPRMLKEFLSNYHGNMGDVHFHRRMVDDRADGQVRQVSLHKLGFSDWTEKVQVASPAEKALAPLLEERVRFGNYWHDLMAMVRHAGDVDRALQLFVSRQSVDETEVSRLADMAHRVVKHPDCERFFREGFPVKTECDMTDGQGIIRPDRVVFAPEATWVVDFKTGQDLAEQHNRQLLRYCYALSQMGYPSVEGWLIYLDEDIRVRRAV